MLVGRWQAFLGAGEAGARKHGQSAYVRCEHGVAGWGLVHGHRQAEGARPQAAVLQQWDPLGRGWGSGEGRAGARRAGEAEAHGGGASQ